MFLVGQLYYLAGISPLAETCFTPVIQAREKSTSLYEYIKNEAPFKIKDPLLGGCTTSILIPDGNFHLYGVATDRCHFKGSTYVIILRNESRFRLIASQPKSQCYPFYQHLTTSKVLHVRTKMPAYSFVGPFYFMFDKIIFDLLSMDEICYFPHSAPDNIIYTHHSDGDCNFASYHSDRNCLKTFLIDDDLLQGPRLELKMLAETNARRRDEDTPELLIDNPAVSWQCPRTQRIAQIGYVDKKGRFTIFSMQPNGEFRKVTFCKFIDSDWEGFPDMLEDEDDHFDVVLQPTFLSSIDRVIFIATFWRVRVMCLVVVDLFDEDNEGENADPKLYVTPIEDCNTFYNFFPGEHGILLLHLRTGGGEYVHIHYMDSWRLAEEELDPFKKVGQLDCNRLPNPITTISIINRNRIVPFLGPYSEDFYEITNRELTIPVKYRDHEYFLNNKRNTYWRSTYLVGSSKSNGEHVLYLLVCDMKTNPSFELDNHVEKLVNYKHYEFKENRFITIQEQKDNWQMQKIFITSRFRHENAVKDILVAKKHMIPGEHMWKFEIRSTHVIDGELY